MTAAAVSRVRSEKSITSARTDAWFLRNSSRRLARGPTDQKCVVREAGAALFRHRYPNYSAQSASESAGKCSFSLARTAS